MEKENFVKNYFEETRKITETIDYDMIESMVEELADLRSRGGRLFLLGVGGGAANSSHAVNDFRKICGIEAYTPVDNVSELTARTNDEGWESVFIEWLKGSHAKKGDAVFIFSVGGGDLEKNISANLVHALSWAQKEGLKIMGVVGRQGGYTKKIGDAVLVVPTVNENHITFHTEGFQVVALHCLVSHPQLRRAPTKWESIGVQK